MFRCPETAGISGNTHDRRVSTIGNPRKAGRIANLKRSTRHCHRITLPRNTDKICLRTAPMFSSSKNRWWPTDLTRGMSACRWIPSKGQALLAPWRFRAITGVEKLIVIQGRIRRGSIHRDRPRPALYQNDLARGRRNCTTYPQVPRDPEL